MHAQHTIRHRLRFDPGARERISLAARDIGDISGKRLQFGLGKVSPDIGKQRVAEPIARDFVRTLNDDSARHPWGERRVRLGHFYGSRNDGLGGGGGLRGLRKGPFDHRRVGAI